MGNKTSKRKNARRAASFLAVLGVLVLSSGVALMASAGSASAADKVTFCHSTGSESNPWETITTDVDAFYHGHVLQQHTEDIYPDITFDIGQKTIHVAAQGDQAVLANDCKPVEEPGPTVCPEGTDKAGQTIPEGETVESFCTEVAPPTVCPEGTDKAGQTVPEGQTIESFCTNVVSAPVVCPEGTDNAGQTVPEGQTIESFCSQAVVSPPQIVSTPKHKAKAKAAAVTPTVVEAGLSGATVQDMRAEQGLALMVAGMVLLVGAGGLGLRLRGGASRI